MYICIYVYVCIHIYLCMYAFMYVCVYVFMYVCMCMFVCMCIFICTLMIIGLGIRQILFVFLASTDVPLFECTSFANARHYVLWLSTSCPDNEIRTTNKNKHPLRMSTEACVCICVCVYVFTATLPNITCCRHFLHT